MLGILLLGALLSMLLPGEGAEHKREELLVGHQIENQPSTEDLQLEMTSDNSDSLSDMNGPKTTLK